MDDLFESLLAKWHPRRERCGVILEDGSVVGIRNYAKNLGAGGSEFAMRTKDVMKAVGSATVRGVFHTHPSNVARPSALDIAGWPDGVEYFIITKYLVTEWKLVGSNPVLVAKTRSKVASRVCEASA